MSTRDDARLTAEERAALSGLEALAAAADPQFAARLRGPRRWSVAAYGARLRTLSAVMHVPAWARGFWFAIPTLIVGLVLVVAGVSLGWGVGVVGALLSTAGLMVIVSDAGRRLGQAPGG